MNLAINWIEQQLIKTKISLFKNKMIKMIKKINNKNENEKGIINIIL